MKPSKKLYLRDAIDRAICYRMIVRRYGSFNWEVAFKEDKTTKSSSICETLQEAYDLIPVKRRARDAEEQGDKLW